MATRVPSSTRLLTSERSALACGFLALLGTACGVGGDVPLSLETWSEPVFYQYTVESGCGERDFLGLFDVIVERGQVVDVRGLDERSRQYLESHSVLDVPTLGQLMQRYELTMTRTADIDRSTEATIGYGPDSVPSPILIDYDTRVEDDEECYLVTGFQSLASE